MNGLLAVAAAFLERMTNPQHGIAVNEEYSFRFHQALAADPEFARSFATLDLAAEDVDSVPICAWPWYLQWREEHGSPPAEQFLDALFEYTDDPAVRLAVVQSAVYHDYPARASDEDAATRIGGEVQLRGDSDQERERPRPIQSPWVRARTTRPSRAIAPARSREDASELATYLIQLGDPASLETLRALIEEPEWPGRDSLVATVERHIADAGLDPATAAQWRGRLGLTNREERG